MIVESLFVYGTLKPGEVNHHYLADIKGEWQKAWVRGKLYPLGLGRSSGFPAMVLDESESEIEGWLLSSAQLHQHWHALDEFEGEAYERITVIVRSCDNEFITAYIYALAKSEYV